jgi:2-oxoglutarate dehydrogenase E1 component
LFHGINRQLNEGLFIHHQLASCVYREFVQRFAANPESVDPEMRKFFEGFDFAVSKVPAASNGQQNGQALNGKQVDGQRYKRNLVFSC